MGKEPRFYKVEKVGQIIIWKFHNPPKNLETLETMVELVGLVENFDKDENLKVGIITSAVKGMFIQHFDVSSILGWAEGMSKVSEDVMAKQLAIMPKPKGIAAHTSKPVICAINGPAEGGGCEMALGCDLRFISRDAYMGQPEVDAGIIPGDGGTQRLARLVGVARALEICWTGRRIYPDEAERLGIVVKACDPDDLMPTVMEFAKKLAAKPPLAVKNIKKAIYEGIDLPLEDGLSRERELFFETIRSDVAIQLMKMYVAVGQDREKLAAFMPK